jgi:DNA-binding transcriptional LysR family regulator
MDVRHLEHFVTVAEERNFTRAAQRLHIVQSAVSASIRTLERDLQAELFHRTTQRVELSDAGATLLPQARRILAEVASARELVADVRAGLRGTLTIGAMQSLSAGTVDIAQLLGVFRVSHPLLEIRLRHAPQGSIALAEQLRDGRLDIAILGAEAFIDHPAGWGTRISVDRALSAAGVEHRVVFEVGDTPSVINLVRHGLGVAILPPSIVTERDRVRLVALRGRAPLWEVSLAMPANRPVTAAARAFADAAV